MRAAVACSDVVICASDGLFDNLTEADILEVVRDWDLLYPELALPKHTVETHSRTGVILDGHDARAQGLAVALASKVRSEKCRSRDLIRCFPPLS